MKKISIKKTVSFLCSAALLLTQAIAVLPVSAEETDNKTNLLMEDGFETVNTEIKDRIWNYDSTDGSNATVEFVQDNGNTVLKISKKTSEVNFAKGFGLRTVDGKTTPISMESGKAYTFIYSFRYKVESTSDYGLALSPMMCEWANGYELSGNNWRSNSIVFSNRANAYTPNFNEWNIYYGNSDGNWHNVSMAVKITASAAVNANPSFYLNLAAAQSGVLYIDDVKVLQVADGSTASEFCFETNGGNKIDRVAGVTDENAVLPTPINDGNTFVGWYTDAELTTAFDGKFPSERTTLYAKWKGEPKTVLYDNFEREDAAYKDVNGKGGEALIAPYEGINDSSALFVDMSVAGGTGIVLKPQNSDGSGYSVKSGDAVNLIVKFSYRMDTDSFPWGPLWLKPIIGNESFGALQTLSTFIVGPNVNTPTHTEWNILSTKATGEWRTVSFPISKTAEQSGDFMLFFDTSGQKGSMLIDNLEVISLTSDLKSTAMSLNLNNGAATPELVTMVAGEDISKLPVPEKSGYTFAGWYTDSALTQKCDVVPETTEKYISLYAGYDVPYYTVTEDYERYSETTKITDNLIGALEDGQNFEVLADDNGNKYLNIKTDGKSNFTPLYILKNSDGSGLGQSFANGQKYSLIINFKYRMNDIQNEWGITLKPIIFWPDGKVLYAAYGEPTVFGNYNGDYYHGINDKEWHTMSVSFDYTAADNSSNTDIGFLLDGSNRAFDISFDDISVQVLPSGTSASTVNLDGVVNGQTFVAGIVGSDIIVDDAKLTDTLPKNIYKRAAKFTGYKIGDAEFDGKFPTAGGKLTATFENAASAYDYNFDGDVNILDLVRLKKNLANDSDYANSAPDGGVLLAELRKALLSLDTAKTIGDVSYTLAYSDEFNGTAIDSSIWNVGESTGIVTYGDGVFYKTVLDKNHVSVSDGTAKISFAQDEDKTVSIYKDANDNYYSDPTAEEISANSLTLVNASATLKTVYGGAMRTNGNLEVKRGYIEANVKFASKTIDSAFWLNATATPTLRYNEIDIFETFGQDFARSNIHTWDNNYKPEGGTNFHYDWSSLIGEEASKIITGIYDGKFHTIGLQWEESYLKFYCDGDLKLTVSRTDANSEYFEAFANRLLYTEFSASPKAGFSSWSGLDSSFEIDYIRYYQNSDSNFSMR